MSLLEKRFTVTEMRDCPLYVSEDQFTLEGIALAPPAGKPVCLFLSRVITGLLSQDLEAEVGAETVPRKEFNCPGCSGIIKLTVGEATRYQTRQMQILAQAAKKEQARKLGTLANLLSTFSFFQALEEESLKDIVSCLTMKAFEPEETILHIGHPGRNLYIVVSGQVALLNSHDLTFGFLSQGEIFGEMSLISGRPISATVRAVDAVKVLVLSGKDLSHILARHPHLQMAFTRLLVQRFSSALAQRDEIASGMQGRLLELSAAEILQMLHDNTKTGVVDLDLPAGKAKVIFVDGEVVSARYRSDKGTAAFFAILKERDGRFVFTPSVPLEDMRRPPIGGFMNLLMEGLRQIDEENAGGGRPVARAE
ncbi:MAG: DUF4388 domain-containing protein [Thermodesulfobacteriota bacterium]